MVDVKRGMPLQVGDLFEHTVRGKKHQVEVVDLLPTMFEDEAVVRDVDSGKRQRVATSTLRSRWTCVQAVEQVCA